MISVVLETAKAAAVEMSGAPVPTPGQTALIESNSFTSDKFVSKRSSKKWDVPPSGVSQKKAGKTFDVTTADPSEFVPKVVPMCEVENALGREEGMGVMEEGGRDVVSIRQETTQSTPETEVLLNSCTFVSVNLPYFSPLTEIRSGYKNLRK